MDSTATSEDATTGKKVAGRNVNFSPWGHPQKAKIMVGAAAEEVVDGQKVVGKQINLPPSLYQGYP
jgi:hypothetical protein